MVSLSRELAHLRADPELARPELLTNSLVQYRRYRERLQLDRVVLLNLERFDSVDSKLTSMLQRLCTECGVEEVASVVVAMSRDDYSSSPQTGFILAPVEIGLLGLPALLHEKGHFLLGRPPMDGVAATCAAAYGDLLTIALRNASLSADQATELAGSWASRWLPELLCDALGTFACGPAYAWQHFVFVLGHGRSPREPVVGSRAYRSHPADAARLALMFGILERDGHQTDELRAVWESYLQLHGSEGSLFTLTYPDDAITSIVDSTLAAFAKAKVRPASALVQADTVVKVTNDAWTQFRRDPAGYRTWEKTALQALTPI